MAITAGIPYTANQLLDIALTVLRNTRDFERALGDWALKPAEDKTWSTFKAHFTAAQAQLKAIRGPTMHQAGYHHANLLAHQLRNDFRENLDSHNNDFLAFIQTAMEASKQTAPTKASTAMSTLTPATHQVHATTTDAVQLQILQLLQQMQKDSTGNKPKPPNAPRRQPRKTPDDASYPRRVTNKYCWTHGGCTHDSPDCQGKANGHQDGATFANQMGGSKAYCS